MSDAITRRQLLKIASTAGASLAFGTSPALNLGRPWTERRDRFPQGVASGDPTSNSVILWTRRPTDKDSSAHELDVEVAEDRDFVRIVATGRAAIGPEADWTCRFLAAGLKPRLEYWYRFKD